MSERDELKRLVDTELAPTLSLLERLVREPSVEGSDSIARCLDIIEEALAPLGARVQRPEFDGLSNLVCEWGDPTDQRRLLLTGHCDVVPADGAWNTPPFSLVRDGDALSGRGVCDMKGALAAFVGALNVVARHDRLDDVPVSLVVTSDEEVGSARGMIPLLDEQRVAGSWAVCGEPTGLDVYTGNRGVVWLRIHIQGRGGHAGLAHALDNPLPVAVSVAAALQSLPLTVRDERFDPPAPSCTLTWLQIDGEPVVNIVPDAVSIGVDRRLLPGESPEAAVEQISDAVANCVSAPFEAQVIVDWIVPPYIAAAADPFIGIAQQAVREVGRSGALGTDSAADDSSWLGNAGISTILCGPGAPEQAHTTGETVAVAEIRDAIEIYARLALATRETW